MAECLFNGQTGASMDPKRVLVIPTAGAQRRPSQPLAKSIPTSSPDSTFEVLGPTENINCITPNFYFNYKVTSCVVLVYRQFSSKALLHTVHFLPEFHLIPEFLGVDSTKSKEKKRERILRNIKKQTRLDEQEIFQDTKKTLDQINTARSIRCMIGTSRKGYLYDVSDPRLLSEYSFTEHTISLKMTSSVMYTLTQSTLIMWSIRCCSSAGELFPAPCVLGMEVVQNPRHITIVGDYLIVTPYLEEYEHIPKSNTPTTVLHTKSLLSLFDEIRAFALLNEKTSYEAYFQLMLELHFLLEAKLQSLNQRLMRTDYYSSIFYDEQNNQNEEEKEQKNVTDNNKNRLQIESSSNNNIIDLSRKRNPNLLNEAEKAQELDQLQIESTLYHVKHKESSAALGDYQFRTELFQRAAVFYAESDRLMSEIIEPMLNAATQEEATSSARRGILHYLDAVLFDQDKKQILKETTELSDKILAIYHTFARSRLASVILESSLKKYNQETALRLLEDPRTMNNNNSNTPITKKLHSSVPIIKPPSSEPLISISGNSHLTFQSGISLKNVFVRGLLYLEFGKLEEASADFLSLEPDVLIDFCTQNPQIFNPDIETNKINQSNNKSILPGIKTLHRQSEEQKLTTVAQLLYNNDPWILLDIFTSPSFSYFPISDGLRILQFNCIDELHGDMLFLLENYLEWILLSGKGRTDVIEALSLIYFRHILSNCNEQPKCKLNDVNRKDHRKKWKRINRDSLIHQREEWLHQIEPFDGTNYFPSRSPFEEEDEPLPELFYLQKIQGLLSLDEVILNYPGCVDKLYSKISKEKNFIGKMSLELLCLPLTEKLMDAMEFVVKNCPHITCLFSVKYCRTQDQWKSVLDYLSNTITSCQVYTDIISHLVRNQDPITFVSLLPENGNINFFLPFIEQSFRCHYSVCLKQSIVDQAKNRVTPQ